MYPTPDNDIIARQIWVEPTPTSGALPHTCTPFRLSSGGAINIGKDTIITLTQDAVFQPPCPGFSVSPPLDPVQPGVDLSVLDNQAPWYSSTTPQIFAISAVTIVSYMLVLILFITPRTFFVGGAGGGGGFLGSRGVVSGAYGSNSVIGIGGRPWLQKIAALGVAISLTIVTADTFKWAQIQYHAGYEDATELTIKVINGTEVRIVRVISETFLWLAQAQTLIRLFPRHKEKLLIKWIAFALIILELIFSILNQFLAEESKSRERIFASAISALNYLFAFTLNICYLGFVLFYVLGRRRYAFYHSHMRNMPLVALLSLTAIFIPVVFFVLDLSKPNVSGWGSYVRWVGSAAASVVVWEWVERIEALERDEKKGGILGREIFDGDELLDATPGSDGSLPNSRKGPNQRAKRRFLPGFGVSSSWSSMTIRARGQGRSQELRNLDTDHKMHDQSRHLGASSSPSTDSQANGHPHALPRLPAAIASPVSRTDTTSPGSMVYVVHYHSSHEMTNSTHDEAAYAGQGRGDRPQRDYERSLNERVHEDGVETQGFSLAITARHILQNLPKFPNPFGRARETPPLEVARALADRPQDPATGPQEPISIFQRLRLRTAPKVNSPPRPVIVVPAPPRRQSTWSDAASEDSEQRNEDEEPRPYSEGETHNTTP